MSKNNRITIFSNGMADYRRYFDLKPNEPTEIGIPVNKEHLADVIGSINVFGAAKLVQPPTYRPDTDNQTNLQVNTDNVIRSLASQLQGAEVKVKPLGAGGEELTGQVIGLESFEKATGGEAVYNYHLVVLTSSGLQKISLENIASLEWTQEQIRSEVDKALRQAFEKIRPNSTQITLALEAAEAAKGGEACVHYAVPAAAWKMSYRLREAGDFYEFQALAHVDNNTEEDWTDAILSVVTGEPITFSTDLASAKVPPRGHQNIVSAKAQGAVEAERGVRTRAARMMAKSASRSHLESVEDFGAISHDEVLAAACSMSPEGVTVDDDIDISAQTGDVNVREVGDFSIWEAADPVNIPAGSSATIPVTTKQLEKAEGTVYYNESQNATRPFSAIRFTNETENNFGRGVVTTFQDGTYAGYAILNATKPGDEEFIIHAVDTGVHVQRDNDATPQEVISIKCAKGVAQVTRQYVTNAIYTIDQSTDKDRTLVFDYTKRAGSEWRAEYNKEPVQETKTLPNGLRFELPISKGESTFDVRERTVQVTLLQLAHWPNFLTVVGQADDELIQTPSIQTVIKAQEGLSEAKNKLSDAQEELKRFRTQESDARKNLEADQDNQLWKDEMQSAYQKAKKLNEETIPELEQAVDAAQEAVAEAIKAVKFEWEI